MRSLFNKFMGVIGGSVGAQVGKKLGTVSGTAVSGTPGGVVGGAVGGFVGMYGGRKTAATLVNDESFANRSIFDQDLLIAYAVGGMTQYALNSMHMPNQAAWRGAASEINAVRAQMTQEQLDFAAAVLSSDETFRGEMTVNGNPLGSWITYVHKMILIDEDRARRVFTPIVMTHNTSQLHNNLVWNMVVEFWSGINPDLFGNVLSAAENSAITVDALKTLFQRSKPKQEKPQPKPLKRRKRPPGKRRRRM
ncbi:MAG: hypothetical protein VYB51_04245, partial [Gemmatimonadota bacterium]|nr:hypothetical protein [Gemmatimonadota bacterium]